MENSIFCAVDLTSLKSSGNLVHESEPLNSEVFKPNIFVLNIVHVITCPRNYIGYFRD